MKNLIYLLAIITIVSCKKPEKQVPSTTSASLIGTWKTTSLHGKFYKNNVLTIDTTFFAPYTNEVDVIETIRFTNSMVFLKMNNDSVGEFYNYFISNNYILITDSISSDTLLFINNHTSTNFDFTLDYTGYYNDSTGTFLGRNVLAYKSIKQ